MKRKRTVITKEHLGKWIAWDERGEKIIASGRRFVDVQQAAKDKGEPVPLMEKVPTGLFVGYGWSLTTRLGQ